MSDEPVSQYVHQRVQRGATVLDETFPGWPADVNVEALDMHSLDDCVLGQVAHARLVVTEDDGDTGWGVGMLHLFESTESSVAKDYGFEDPRAYVELGHAWRALIEERCAVSA